MIAHDRRRILHCNVTRHPTGFRISQQLREAFPYDQRHRYLVHDRDAKFGDAVNEAIAAIGLLPARTSFRSPWQNGIAERWVGSCRRDLLDHVIPLNAKHLKRLLLEYIRYYHEDRTHLGLKKDTPISRVTAKAGGDPQIMSARAWQIYNKAARVLALWKLLKLRQIRILGSLHHRYDIAA
jgi:putative transposase